MMKSKILSVLATALVQLTLAAAPMGTAFTYQGHLNDGRAPGFTLEECTALNSGPWNATPQSVVDTATDHTVTVSAAGVIKRYRLKK